MTDKGESEKHLVKIIDNATKKSDPKTVMSAYSSLKFLESKKAEEFEDTDLFDFLKKADSWDNSIEIARQHWEFWRKIESTKSA